VAEQIILLDKKVKSPEQEIGNEDGEVMPF
jgi:hypothetical protein